MRWIRAAAGMERAALATWGGRRWPGYLHGGAIGQRDRKWVPHGSETKRGSHVGLGSCLGLTMKQRKGEGGGGWVGLVCQDQHPLKWVPNVIVH